MARLPQPGGDSGNWGDILNDFLLQSHKPDGSLETDSVTADAIAPGAVTKADVGLGSVDNTSDAGKPISSATQTALDAKLNVADLDAQVADKIVTNGTDTQEALAGTIAAATALPTKRVTMSLGATTSSAAVSGTLTDWVERFPILLPIPTTRWRLRIGNRNLMNNTALTSVFTISDIYQGASTVPTTGRQTAAYTTTPVVVATGGQNGSDGSDFVSAWVTDAARQFGPTAARTISWNLSAVVNGNGYGTKASRYGWRNSNAGAAATITNTASTGYASTTGILDVRLEYEFVGNSPVGLYVGASNDEGYNIGEDTGTLLIGAHEAWPGAFGMRRKIPWVNAGIAGATETPFMSASNLAYTRFDLTTTVPDFAVVNLSGNSVNNSVAAATIQSNYASVISALRTLGIPRIFLTTVQPLGYASDADAKEIVRDAMNVWLRGLPGAVHGIIDFDYILRSPTSSLALHDEFKLADGIHFKRGGHQFLAERVGITA